MNLDLYVDGSYSKSEPNITKGGIVLLDRDKNEVVSVRHVYSNNPDFIKANNDGGEVVAAIIGILESAIYCRGEKSNIRVFYDYRGVADFITGVYRAKAPGMVQYVQHVAKVRRDHPNVKLEFVKVKAHSGVRYNELADSVANGNIPPQYRSVRKETLSM